MPINLNGKIIAADQPIFTAGNRAFRYGDGLFESIRVFGGRLPFFERHWQRLSAGFGLLKFEVPDFFTPSFLKNEVGKLTQSKGNWRIRLSVWRSGGGLYTPEINLPEFLIEANPLTSALFELNQCGLKIGIFNQELLPHHSQKTYQNLHNLKTTSALPFVLASIFKKENQLDDYLLLNTVGRLACASSSNIFLVKNGELFTPPLTEGCIAGTMRATVLELAGQLGIKTNEVQIPICELEKADEILLTNAIQGVRWVQKIQGQNTQFQCKTAGILVDALNQQLERFE
ncbi:MAG: aminotransferase class IV [Saprospiraceae bacterium]|nr:aminotransferase class IV [Saprospiraceae bacterium]